jgi:hypothetical protein
MTDPSGLPRPRSYVLHPMCQRPASRRRRARPLSGRRSSLAGIRRVRDAEPARLVARGLILS